jgi:alanyl-tRNA synthetase
VLAKKLEAFENEKIQVVKSQLAGSVQKMGDIHFINANLNLPTADAAKQLCFQLKQEFKNLVCVLGYVAEEKPGLAIYIEENLVAKKGLDASSMVRECGKFIQGGGGGQKFFATAGGKDASGLDQAIAKAKEILGF